MEAERRVGKRKRRKASALVTLRRHVLSVFSNDDEKSIVVEDCRKKRCRLTSVLKESEVKVETEDLGGRGGRSGEEGEGRDDDASRDHGDWSEVGESEVREKGEKLSEESGGDWGGRSW
jgi:hypothetical protein